MSERKSRPVFGFVLFGGPLSGALIRDMRLANELARRGYTVHVWWVMDKCKHSPLRDDIHQHWLFNAIRYGRLGSLGDVARGLKDALGRLGTALFSDNVRNNYLQQRPWLMNWIMRGLTQRVCDGVADDQKLARRFAREIEAAGVTHMLPMLSILCPFVEAARRVSSRRFEYVVTFQGYELYANYARSMGCEAKLYERLVEAVEQSGHPAIAVSEDYARRIHDDLGLALEKMRAIPPGVPLPQRIDRAAAIAEFAKSHPRYRPDVPLVTFIGRQDSEKGIDLLLYAMTMLHRRGVPFQLAICGPTLFGDGYKRTCAEIAENLRCPVFKWKRRIDEKTRELLFAMSTCVVYPSIHREPFGMVPVEAMAYGTPAVVPDHGGVASVIEANGVCGGVRFKVWDSGDLADQIERVITDQALWKRLSDAGPRVAEYFSIPRLADRVLAHLGLAEDREQTAAEGREAAMLTATTSRLSFIEMR